MIAHSRAARECAIMYIDVKAYVDSTVGNILYSLAQECKGDCRCQISSKNKKLRHPQPRKTLHFRSFFIDFSANTLKRLVEPLLEPCPALRATSCDYK